MNEEELINILNKTNQVNIKLEGIINTNLTIENPEAFLQKDKLKIINKKEKNNYIAFNRHQLIKIEDTKKEIKLLFDQLQKAIIK